MVSVSLVASEPVPHVQHAPPALKVADPQVLAPVWHILPGGILEALLHVPGRLETLAVHHTLQQVTAETRAGRRHSVFNWKKEKEEEEEEEEIGEGGPKSH